MPLSQPAGIKPKSFWIRTLTGAVYAVVFLGSILVGNRFLVLPALCCVLSFLGCREFYHVTSPDMNRIPRALGTLLGMSLPVITAFARLNTERNPVIGTGGLAGLIALFYAVAVGSLALTAWVAFTPTSSVRDSALALFGALYLGVPLASLVLIREMQGGIYLATMTALSVWAADSFAYLGGSLFGRHKIAPVISPKKSWEGFIAGMLGAIAIWCVLPFAMGIEAHFIGLALVGVLVSIAALAGDLFESRMKREAGLKDSGHILPGHGGILDRIDSLLAVTTVLFILLSIVGVFLGVVSL